MSSVTPFAIASALACSFFAGSGAFAEGNFSAPSIYPSENSARSATLIAQNPSQNPALNQSLLPLPSLGKRVGGVERFRLNLLERYTPSRFFLDTSTETSFRLNTNPFQFPNKSVLLKQQPTPDIFAQLDQQTQFAILDQFKLVNRTDVAYRVIPNVTAGFMLTPNTKIYSNYFFIRDKFYKNNILSTISHSVSGGITNNKTLGKRFNLTTDFQFRELYVRTQQPLFDFLPSATLSCAITPSTSATFSTLMQLRGKHYFQAPTKEIDVFYTLGLSHVRGPWALTSSLLFLTNYRCFFLSRASEQNQDPFAYILDVELSRTLWQKYPGLRWFVRSENIYNFNTNNTPGASGMDYRLFWGVRYAASKQARYPFVSEIRRQLMLKEKQTATPAQQIQKQEEPGDVETSN